MDSLAPGTTPPSTLPQVWLCSQANSEIRLTYFPVSFKQRKRRLFLVVQHRAEDGLFGLMRPRAYL